MSTSHLHPHQHIHAQSAPLMGAPSDSAPLAAAPATPPAASVPLERIAAKAYDIWLAKGCPERCDLEHWEAARQELTRTQMMT
ncbi:DUF2934 domain-containing protein [Prosthecobacter sp.]|uniref:DUF2934 domain-containing protein n=1 Tax=Prosthecobacter sp. TaxID=1965333 RepID=UPI0037852B66